MRNIEKAEKEVAQGNLWRAKEILQGTLSNVDYSCELFEKYGVVLLMMGDLPEAGKYLFLSGIRKQEYLQAISVFLRKHQSNQHAFINTLPRKAKLATLTEYPDTVTRELRELGFPEVLRNKEGQSILPPKAGGDAVAWVTCLVIILLVVGLLILGVIKLVELIS